MRVAPRRGAAGLALAALLATFSSVACGSGDDAEPSPATPSATAPTVAPTTAPAFIATPAATPSRFAPDTTSGPLQFSHIEVFADPQTGIFTVRTRVTNTSADFLNGVAFDWTILDTAGQPLDTGQGDWPTLAPG